MTDRVRQILSWYQGENPGVLSNLYRLMNTGKLAGTGKFVILPVDQGFEHGPARSFAPNVPAYDPRYHYQLALDAGCNAYAAPLGFLEAGAAEYAGQIPLILKVNNHDVLQDEKDPLGAQTATVDDALRLGCSAIGYTIYPGTVDRRMQYEQVRDLIREARSRGLPTVMWAYPRGGALSKDGETGLDVTGYAAHIACELGAHIVKVKLPTDFLEQKAAKDVYEKFKVERDTLAKRVSHIVKCAFDGRRIVIFSGGAKKDDDNAVLDEARAIRDGGGFGSIMGRNAFQRSKPDALKLLGDVIGILKGDKK
ncbi:MAG TPA: class I fructose-bisphosphate aldolase [bacterium]|nr:class I fructose-bisphosphate aldolase [bacterium]